MDTSFDDKYQSRALGGCDRRAEELILVLLSQHLPFFCNHDVVYSEYHFL